MVGGTHVRDEVWVCAASQKKAAQTWLATERFHAGSPERKPAARARSGGGAAAQVKGKGGKAVAVKGGSNTYKMLLGSVGRREGAPLSLDQLKAKAEEYSQKEAAEQVKMVEALRSRLQELGGGDEPTPPGKRQRVTRAQGRKPDDDEDFEEDEGRNSEALQALLDRVRIDRKALSQEERKQLAKGWAKVRLHVPDIWLLRVDGLQHVLDKLGGEGVLFAKDSQLKFYDLRTRKAELQEVLVSILIKDARWKMNSDFDFTEEEASIPTGTSAYRQIAHRYVKLMGHGRGQGEAEVEAEEGTDEQQLEEGPNCEVPTELLSETEDVVPRAEPAEPAEPAKAAPAAAARTRRHLSHTAPAADAFAATGDDSEEMQEAAEMQEAVAADEETASEAASEARADQSAVAAAEDVEAAGTLQGLGAMVLCDVCQTVVPAAEVESVGFQYKCLSRDQCQARLEAGGRGKRRGGHQMRFAPSLCH